MEKLVVTENVKRTSFKIGGAPIVVNQQYDLSLAATIEIENILGYPSEPMDFFKYKIVDTDIDSVNEGLVRISFEVDTSTLPIEYNLIQNVNINDSFKFTDLIPASQNYDRIKINSIEGKGTWLLNAIPLEVGKEFFYYQLVDNLVFVASESGSRSDYNSLKWQFGHKLGYWSHENSIDVNALSLSQITTANPEQPIEKVDTIDIIEYEVNISNGPDSGTFKTVLDTTAFTAIGSPVENRVKLVNNGIETFYNTSGTFDITGDLDSSGNAILQITLERLYPYTTASSVKIDLTEINGVSGTINTFKNNVVLNNPISI